MKKIIAMILVLVLVLSLAACAAKTTPAVKDDPAPAAPEKTATEETPEETPAEQEIADLAFDGVKLNLWMCPLNSMDADKAFWDDALQGFTAQTGATVNVEIVDWAELDNKLHTSWMAGNCADVTYTYAAMHKDGAEHGFLEPLNQYFTEDEVAQENFWNAVAFNGDHYGVPIAGGGSVRTYTFNMDILNECGVTEIPTTWDELLDVCAKIHEQRPDVYTFLVPLSGNTNCFDCGLLNFIFQAGGNLVSADGNTCLADSEEVYNAFDFMMKLIDNGYWSKDALGLDFDSVVELFKQGNVAITCVHTPSARFGDCEFNWIGSTALKGVQEGVFNAVDCLSISAQSENKEAAVALLKYMRSAEIMNRYNTEIYPGNGQLVSSWNAPEIDERVADVMAHLERSMSIPANGFQGIIDSFVKNMQLCASGDITIEEAQTRIMMDNEAN